MAEPIVISALVKKRAELAGDIENAQAKLHQMILDLEHLDQALALFDPTYEIASIKPRGFRPPPDWARRVDERVFSVLPGPQRERFVQDLNAIVVALGKLEAADLSDNN